LGTKKKNLNGLRVETAVVFFLGKKMAEIGAAHLPKIPDDAEDSGEEAGLDEDCFTWMFLLVPQGTGL
jgi:hypothetical protein